MIDRASDPLTAAVEFTDRMEICCRHEMDLIFSYVAAIWDNHHQS